jgi:hypothetical protein
LRERDCLMTQVRHYGGVISCSMQRKWDFCQKGCSCKCSLAWCQFDTCQLSKYLGVCGREIMTMCTHDHYKVGWLSGILHQIQPPDKRCIVGGGNTELGKLHDTHVQQVAYIAHTPLCFNTMRPESKSLIKIPRRKIMVCGEYSSLNYDYILKPPIIDRI